MQQWHSRAAWWAGNAVLLHHELDFLACVNTEVVSSRWRHMYNIALARRYGIASG